MLLRALSIRPDLILLDEPTNGLDLDVKFEFLVALKSLVKKYNVLAIYVTHHKQEVELIADEILYIYKNDKAKAHQVLKSSLRDQGEYFSHIDLCSIFNYPSPNVIRMKSYNSGLELCTGVEVKCYSTVLKDTNIVFDDSEGFDFEILFFNKTYTTIRIANEYLVTVKKSVGAIERFEKVQFVGKLPLYGPSGAFLEEINVTK